MKKKGLWLNDSTFVEFPNKGGQETSLTQEIATRGRSIDYLSLSMYLPDPDPVLRKQGKDIRVYKELLSDPRVGPCVESRHAGVLSKKWVLQGDGPKKEALKKLYKRLDIYRIISEMLNFHLFGYQPMEVLPEIRDGLLVPRDIVGKPQEWFVYDVEGNLRFRTKENPIQGELLPDRRFLCPRNRASYQNPYGQRILSRVFWPVAFKKGGMRFWVTFAEKYGTPYLIGKQPRGLGETETNKLLAMLEQMIQDAVAVVPDDSSVDILEAGGKGASATLYKDLKDSCNEDIAVAILGQNLTTSVQGGSLAASNNHMKVREDIVDGDCVEIARNFNQLNRWIDEWNWGGTGEDLPAFIFLDDEDDNALATRDKTLSETGVKFTKRYFVRKYGFAEDEIEITQGASLSGSAGSMFREFSLNKGGQGVVASAEDLPDRLTGKLAQAATQFSDGFIDPIKALVDKAQSLEEIRDGLLDLYPDINPADLGQLMGQALMTADLSGRFEVLNEIKSEG